MLFEIGKCYTFQNQLMMKVIGEIKEGESIPFGAALIGEVMGEKGPELKAVTRGGAGTAGWKQIPNDLYEKRMYPEKKGAAAKQKIARGLAVKLNLEILEGGKNAPGHN